MKMDRDYADEILAAVGDKGPITRREFLELCRADLNAGYFDEVDAAWESYRALYVPPSAKAEGK
jgi:hypothetical protein